MASQPTVTGHGSCAPPLLVTKDVERDAEVIACIGSYSSADELTATEVPKVTEGRRERDLSPKTGRAELRRAVDDVGGDGVRKKRLKQCNNREEGGTVGVNGQKVVKLGPRSTGTAHFQQDVPEQSLATRRSGNSQGSGDGVEADPSRLGTVVAPISDVCDRVECRSDEDCVVTGSAVVAPYPVSSRQRGSVAEKNSKPAKPTGGSLPVHVNTLSVPPGGMSQFVRHALHSSTAFGESTADKTTDLDTVERRTEIQKALDVLQSLPAEEQWKIFSTRGMERDNVKGNSIPDFPPLETADVGEELVRNSVLDDPHGVIEMEAPNQRSPPPSRSKRSSKSKKSKSKGERKCGGKWRSKRGDHSKLTGKRTAEFRVGKEKRRGQRRLYEEDSESKDEDSATEGGTEGQSGVELADPESPLSTGGKSTVGLDSDVATPTGQATSGGRRASRSKKHRSPEREIGRSGRQIRKKSSREQETTSESGSDSDSSWASIKDVPNVIVNPDGMPSGPY
ncbi:hypothetical protein M758_UG220300 [Ceratodon purpureus]|nr:hypothetical protein M758_UG220300 [Ceratodon purpureus]